MYFYYFETSFLLGKSKTTAHTQKTKTKRIPNPKTDSDEGDLSPDTIKPTKKNKQIKTSDTISQPKIKATKASAKKASTPKVPSTDPEPPTKKTHEQLESDNSSSGAEGPKVKTLP